MNESILVTGGAGFVGSNLALRLKEDFPDHRVIAFDNLKRRGSEVNIPSLKAAGVEFIHGDIRNKEDLEAIGAFSLLVDAAAEPSVLSGINSSPDYVLNTNLFGTVNCLNQVVKYKAKVVFLSTSRVYPISALNKIKITESATRFDIEAVQHIHGVSSRGITDEFPLTGARSFYGTSKLSSEMLIQEYAEFYGVNAIINRCGVIAGPGQMGKVDQGIVALWVASHFWKKQLSYIGFGGEGKQVRDLLHINDLYAVLVQQIRDFTTHSGAIYNVGGGVSVSASLRELTTLCEQITGNKILIKSVSEGRSADVPIYITDNKKISEKTGWQPKCRTEKIVTDVFEWLHKNESVLKSYFT